ncbi:MAG TPA: OmpA family protein [Cytophagaceae bacterium]|jgi:flagellar motor protein MotB|nr:OmpA family protein [Cytophagaceae bacterium]
MRPTNIWINAIAFLLITFSYSALQAQDNSKEFKKLVAEGKENLDIEEYDAALVSFLKADKLKPKDPELSDLIAQCYLGLGDDHKALPYLLSAKEGGIKNPDIDFNLGRAYHLAHKFPEAIQSLQKYKTTLKASDIEKNQQTDQLIGWCKNGEELIQKPVKVKITNLGSGVNSKFPDYVPAISADETTLLFTSRRDNTTGGKIDEADGHFHEDVYVSTKTDSVWGKAVQLSGVINTPTHDACAGISPDGQEMFVYRHSKADGGDLYISELKGTEWSAPKNLGPHINSKAWEPSASITSDERVLFFVSNKEGGSGGRDIYMAKKLPNGEYALPINLGPKINTKFEEDCPFIHADGKTLYFSSKGHKSMGGFDIFSCTINTETGQILTNPVNIGYPINTAGDDIFFVWSADNKRAYFSSVREGGYGDKDLYVLERDEANVALVVFKGKISSCSDSKPIGATIIVLDNLTGKPVGVYNSNSSTGKYTIILPAGKNYGISIEAPGFLFYSKNIDIPFLNHYMEILDTVCMEQIKIGNKIVLRNVFFDLDKATLRPESESELERLHEILVKNPHIKIQILGHTDSDGSEEHNLKLSDARAKAVVDYMVKKGVDPSRMKFHGYGETKPIAPNDTPENKQLNRRTEFEILEE